MTTQRVTIELPEPVFRQLVRIAEATHQPIEILVAQSVISNLPPSADNVSPEMQPEFLRMQTLNTEELFLITQAQLEPNKHQRQVELLAKNEASLLTKSDMQELSDLRLASDRLMLRKAYALSLLRWRGQKIPTLKELPIPL